MSQDDLFAPALDPSLPLADREARRRIETDLEASLFVEAAAGTGKTTALVRRILRLLETGRVRLPSLVALTYTDKAAGEMRLRLRESIERVRAASDDAEVVARLERATRELERAPIGTIHSFCSDILKEWPVEAGVDPGFTVGAGGIGAAAFERAFDRWFESTLAAPPPGVARVLRWEFRGDETVRERLRAAAEDLRDHRDFEGAWTRPDWNREQDLDDLVAGIRELAAVAPHVDHPDRDPGWGLRFLHSWVAELDRREAAAGRDHDDLEAALRALRTPPWRVRRRLWERRGGGSRLGTTPEGVEIRREDVVERRDRLSVRFDEVLARADADLAARLREELRPAIASYAGEKRREGIVDFLDLLLATRNLIRSNREVRATLQERYSHFFVDEFQDTDPLQTEILLLLCADDPDVTAFRDVRPVRGKLFLVGDPKQAIYRFRRADVELYQSVKRQLLETGTELLHLRTSFRSTPEIQQAVNGAFARAMRSGDDPEQAEYVGLERYRADPANRPSVVVLPVPRPYSESGYPRITRRAIEASYPEAVGAWIRWLLDESGWTVTERGAEDPVPVDAKHVCVLTRRLRSAWGDPTWPYVRALERRSIPHVLVGGRSFHDREEVLAMRSALRAIEWPDDALEVYATLRGPLFSLADRELLAYEAAGGSLHPLAPRAEPGALPEPADGTEREAVAAVAGALDVLRRLHFDRNRQRIASTLHQLLDAVRAHAGIANWANGEQALANCLRVIDQAREFEAGGAPSFRGFVDWLDRRAEREGGEEAPIVEEGTDGVRMMSVHRAKGLEFPVVILADPTAALTFRTPSRHIDPERGVWAERLLGCVPADLAEHADRELSREASEAVRLAYVAATRARDVLVIPALGDQRMEVVASGWLDPLMMAAYPVDGRGHAPSVSPGCPPFGARTLVQPPAAGGGPDREVVPGLHVSEAGSPATWWDAARLDEPDQARPGLRAARILAEGEAEGTAAGFADFEAWRERLESVRHRGARTELVAVSVTEVAHDPDAPGLRGTAQVDVQVLDRAGGSPPGGSRYGSLVHAVLAAHDLAAPPESAGPLIDEYARLLGATEEEIAGARLAVARALGHELLGRAARADEVRRETPVYWAGPERRVYEGVLDLAFREGTGTGARWTVVDFKTDRDPMIGREAYERQAGLYAEAVAAATGKPTSAVVLVI